jgi:hypothetical protein
VVRVQDVARAVGDGLEQRLERDRRVHGQRGRGQPLQLLVVAQLAREQARALLLGPLALDAERDRVAYGAEHLDGVARQRVAGDHADHADGALAEQEREGCHRDQPFAHDPGPVGDPRVAGRVVAVVRLALPGHQPDRALSDRDAAVLLVEGRGHPGAGRELEHLVGVVQGPDA